MSIINTIKASLGGGPTQMYTYQCTVCHRTFESDEVEAERVWCPHCGSNSVRERPTVEA